MTSRAMPISPATHSRRGASTGSNNFAALSAKLPTGMDTATKARRKALFRSVDVNGNGFLSQAEVDKAIMQLMGSEGLFKAKPVISRAFHAAKSCGAGGSPDYVEKSEFRLLLVYLRQYFELYIAYDRLDSSDDRRLSLPEFRSGVQLLARWGIDIAEEDIEREFHTIDTNGGGIILFDEVTQLRPMDLTTTNGCTQGASPWP